jgi:hypothetical protein
MEVMQIKGYVKKNELLSITDTRSFFCKNSSLPLPVPLSLAYPG